MVFIYHCDREADAQCSLQSTRTVMIACCSLFRCCYLMSTCSILLFALFFLPFLCASTSICIYLYMSSWSSVHLCQFFFLCQFGLESDYPSAFAVTPLHTFDALSFPLTIPSCFFRFLAISLQNLLLLVTHYNLVNSLVKPMSSCYLRMFSR
ncbi:hypothetical protein DFJ43DRAFT_362391 [Lentinula guzmanii]|uniref:Uncharacterized protein n=1 Tax=Lentinula guzmanii TaxID=2804957 RepID=A0AA38MZL5_9AGAR|nr:hypothetical protein DFJ43DRAFT_362391 [Lentinula guzmanii]